MKLVKPILVLLVCAATTNVAFALHRSHSPHCPEPSEFVRAHVNVLTTNNGDQFVPGNAQAQRLFADADLGAGRSCASLNIYDHGCRASQETPPMVGNVCFYQSINLFKDFSHTWGPIEVIYAGSIYNH